MPRAEANCCPFSARGSCSAQSRRLLLQCPVDREAPRAGLRSRLKCEKSSNFPKSGICPKPPHITRSCSSRLLRLARRPARAGRLPATARRHPKCEWHVRRGHSHLLTSHSEQASRLLVSHLTLANSRDRCDRTPRVDFVVQQRRLRRSATSASSFASSAAAAPTSHAAHAWKSAHAWHAWHAAAAHPTHPSHHPLKHLWVDLLPTAATCGEGSGRRGEHLHAEGIGKSSRSRRTPAHYSAR